MKRHRTDVGTALALALSLAPSRSLATDDKPCGHIDRLLLEAATGFHAIAAPSPENRQGVSLVLPGAKECTLDDDSVYQCEWVVESPAKGIQEFEAFAASLATCLTSKGFDVDHRPGFFHAIRRGTASVVASWWREFLTIELQVAKE